MIKMPSLSALMVTSLIPASDARIYTPVPAEVMLPPEISWWWRCWPAPPRRWRWYALWSRW
ncbi:hypothetical protein JT306_00875 [Salmonella enterica subsp. enterica serovar Kentucky]|nr:hypothetical protein [Salmonella enterica subsp. enterica serovar Kentucky]